MEVVNKQKQKFLKFKQSLVQLVEAVCVKVRNPDKYWDRPLKEDTTICFPTFTNIAALIRPYRVCAFLVMTVRVIQNIKLPLCPPWMYVRSGEELRMFVVLGTRWRWLVNFVPQPSCGGWEGAEEPVGTFWKGGKPLALVGNRTTISRSPSL
jgi:hypothetical protein